MVSKTDIAMHKDMIENRSTMVNAIKIKVSELNELVQHAASFQGISTEYMIDKVEEGEADHQLLRVFLSERL